MTRSDLKSHDLPDPPLVVVNRIAPTRSIHVMVIWDKWKNLTTQQRDQVINDAFRSEITRPSRSAASRREPYRADALNPRHGDLGQMEEFDNATARSGYQ